MRPGSRVGAAAKAFCDEGAALCTLIMLPGTQDDLCSLFEFATCCGTSSLGLDACHASPDVSRALKELFTRGALGLEKNRSREAAASKWGTESDGRGRERPPYRNSCKAMYFFLRSVTGGECSAATLRARRAALPSTRRVMDGYEKSAICLIRPVIRARRGES